MANTSDNRRVQYSKSELKKSLLSLLKKKPVDKITVKEICEKALLNRGTFYAHYSSPEELLEEIESEFYVTMVMRIASFQKAEDVPKIVAQILAVLKEQQELASALFGPYGDREFLTKVVNSAHDMCIIQWSGVSPESDRKKMEMTYSFVSCGVARLVQDWLIGGAKEPPEEIAELMNDLCNYGVSAVVDISGVSRPPRVGSRRDRVSRAGEDS